MPKADENVVRSMEYDITRHLDFVQNDLTPGHISCSDYGTKVRTEGGKNEAMERRVEVARLWMEGR